MVQKLIKFLISIFLIISCSTNPEKKITYKEKIKQIQNSSWQVIKGEQRFSFKNGSYTFETKIKGEVCASCIEKGNIRQIEMVNENDAVAIISNETGGSGTFFYLNLYRDKNGKMEQSGFPIFLGDRVQVKKVVLEGNLISVNLIGHSSGEPLCCPTTEEVQKFQIKNGKLIKIKK